MRMTETSSWDEALPEPGGVDPLGAADPAFSGILLIIGLIAVVVVVAIVVRLLRAGRQVAQNVAEEERTVPARVVGKRQETRGGGDSPVTTLSYATFELPDGDRMELKVPRQQYGQLAERDQGQLTHRGTWFRGFERARTTPLEGPWEAPGGPTPLPPSSTP